MAIFIKDFEIDAVISEMHEISSEATDHPVEEGGDITDHVKQKPRMYTMTGKVSNTPIGLLAGRRETDDPASACREMLEQLQRDAELITVNSALEFYDNMVIVQTSFPVDAQTGEALDFTCVFKQILIVETERSAVLVKVPHASKKRNLGSKPTKQNDANTNKKVKGVGGVVGARLEQGTAVSITRENAEAQIKKLGSLFGGS